MAKFKCIASGEVYEFAYEHDIKSMRGHTEYVEIIEQEEQEVKEPVKKAGRPKKEVQVEQEDYKE